MLPTRHYKSMVVMLPLLLTLIVAKFTQSEGAVALYLPAEVHRDHAQEEIQPTSIVFLEGEAGNFGTTASTSLISQAKMDGNRKHLSLRSLLNQFSSNSLVNSTSDSALFQTSSSGCTPGDERSCFMGCRHGVQRCESPDSICAIEVVTEDDSVIKSCVECNCFCMLYDPPNWNDCIFGGGEGYPRYGQWGTCELEPVTEEVCDGDDNDGDCLIDEEVEGCVPGDECGQFTDSPVNLATGILYLDPVTDFVITSPAGDLEFVRHYNTILAQQHAITKSGILGAGWSHPWADLLQWNGPTGQSDAVWITNTGEHLTFKYDSVDNSWSSPVDRKERFSYLGDTITISLPLGEQRIFDNTRRLRSVIRPNGASTTITYHDEQSCSSGNGTAEICTVSLPDGQGIRFNYKSPEILKFATTSTLASISYGVEPPTSATQKLVAYEYSLGWPGWASTYGLEKNDYVDSLTPTSDGGYILAGTREGTRHYDTYGKDIWAVKLDDQGAVEWEKIYGGKSRDVGTSIQPTEDGGYVVAGWTESFGAGSRDAWLIKINTSGELLWQKAYGSLGMDQANSIHPTGDGGFVMAGWTKPSDADSGDAWVIKLDADGKSQWQKAYGGVGNDVFRSIHTSPDGGYLLAGSTNLPGTGDDAWVLKLNALGEIQWQKALGGDAADGANSVHASSDGGYVVAGWTESFGAGSRDAWLVKIDTHGELLWQKVYGSVDMDQANSIKPTKDGGFVMAGWTKPSDAAAGDAWVIKLNSLGEIQWHKAFGGDGTDGANSVHASSDGGYVVAGWTESFGAGSRDAWVIKLDSEGNAGQSCQKAYVPETTATATLPLVSIASIDINDPGFVITMTTGHSGFEYLNVAQQCTGTNMHPDRFYLVGTYYPEAAADGNDLAGYSYAYRIPTPTPNTVSDRITVNRQDLDSVAFIEKVYDADGRLIEKHEYDGYGKVIHSETLESFITIAYSPRQGLSSGPARVVDSMNKTTEESTFIGGRVHSVSSHTCPHCGNAYTYSISPDRNWERTCEQDRFGTLTYYEYDDQHRLIKGVRNAADCAGALRADGKSVSRTYIPHSDPNLDLIAKVIESSNIDSNQTRSTQYVYKDEGALVETIVESGRTHTDVTGNIGEVTYITGFSYDSMGRLLEILGPRPQAEEGSDDRVGYDYYGNTADPLNRGRIYHVKRGWNGTEYTEVTTYGGYTLFGHPTIITDPNGITTYLEYDLKGNLSKQTVPTDFGFATTKYAYTPGGQLDYVRLPKGNYINYTYDSKGFLEQVARQATLSSEPLDSIVFVQNDRNLVETEIHYRGTIEVQRVTYGYNSQRQLAKITVMASPESAQGTTYYLYDGGRLLKIGEPLRQPTADPGPIDSPGWGGVWNVENIYDALGRLEEVKRLIGNSSATWQWHTTAAYGYDPSSNLTSITVKGVATTYKYDDFNRLIQINSPDAGITNYLYDEAGNLTQQKNPDGQVIRYIYDQQNRLTKVEFPSSGAEPWLLGYGETEIQTAKHVEANWFLNNTIGKLSSVRRGSLETFYSYTKDGKLSAEFRADSSLDVFGLRATRYSYDLNGNLSTIQYPISGRLVKYFYDDEDVDRVDAVKIEDRSLISRISYDADGRPLSWVAGEQMYWTTRGLQGRGTAAMTLARVSDEYDMYLQWWTEDLDFDQAGNKLSIIDTIAPEKSVDYSYEPSFARIQSESRRDVPTIMATDLPYSSAVWSYDLAGNRLVSQVDNVAAPYTYYPGTNRLRIDPFERAYDYTPEGQVSNINNIEFTYDEMGRLAIIQGGSDAGSEDQSDGPHANFYTYDFSGHRLEERRVDESLMSAPTSFWYDKSGQLLEIVEPHSHTAELPRIVWDYVYLNGQLIAVIEGEVQRERPSYQEKNVYYVFSGDVSQPLAAVSAEHETLAWKAEYGAYGEAVADLYDVKTESRYRTNRGGLDTEQHTRKTIDKSACPVPDDIYEAPNASCITLDLGSFTFKGGESVRVHISQLILNGNDYLSVQTLNGLEVQRVQAMSDLEDGWTASIPGDEARLRILTPPGKEPGYAAVRTDALARVLGKRERQEFESPHPYPNANCSGAMCGVVWHKKYENPNALQGRICFLQGRTSLRGDAVVIKDENGRILMQQSGTFDNRCTSWLSAKNLDVQIMADSLRAGNAYGIRGFVEWQLPPPNIPQRYPGQEENSFGGSTLYQNWHRWYDPQNGRYLQVDPLLKQVFTIDSSGIQSFTPQNITPGRYNQKLWIGLRKRGGVSS